MNNQPLSLRPANPRQLGSGGFGLVGLWSELASLPRISLLKRCQQCTAQAYRMARASPLTAAVSILTVTVVSFLVATACTALIEIDRELALTRAEVQVTFFLKEGEEREATEALLPALRARPEVESVAFKGKAEALHEFRAMLGSDNALLNGVENDNPLPASVEVRLKPTFATSEALRDFADRFKSSPAVERVVYAHEAAAKLGALVGWFRWIGGSALLIVALVTSCVIANTIKLALYAHRDEIEIMRLVGGTQSFIRGPYLLEGAVHGGIGALIGTTLSALLWYALGRFIGEIEGLNGFSEGASLPWYGWLLMIFSGVVLGGVASWLAVRAFGKEVWQ